MPMGYFNSHSLGNLTSTVTTTISDVENNAPSVLITVIHGFIHVTVITIVMFFFDWRIGLLACLGIALFLLCNSVLQKKSQEVSPKRQAAQEDLVGATLEYIQGMGIVKSFNLGGKSNQKIASRTISSLVNRMPLMKKLSEQQRVRVADPNSDSSIQSYANIYDTNWLTKGNCMIAPGVERVDTVKTDSGYEMKSIWSRNDLSDTSILKLSTATGYIYGYVQDLESGMWQYIILDFATGETVFTMDVSNKYGYNNMAIGMYAGNSGNALYCPTGYLELLCLQDRFVYLPEMPYRKVDLDKAARNVLTQEQFEQDGGEGTVASWRNTVTVENVHPNTTVSFRMNNLSGSAADLKLYAYGADGKLAEVSKELWTITDEAGTGVDTLADGTLYELRVSVADGGAFDLSEAEKEIKISVVLAK